MALAPTSASMPTSHPSPITAPGPILAPAPISASGPTRAPSPIRHPAPSFARGWILHPSRLPVPALRPRARPRTPRVRSAGRPFRVPSSRAGSLPYPPAPRFLFSGGLRPPRLERWPPGAPHASLADQGAAADRHSSSDLAVFPCARVVARSRPRSDVRPASYHRSVSDPDLLVGAGVRPDRSSTHGPFPETRAASDHRVRTSRPPAPTRAPSRITVRWSSSVSSPTVAQAPTLDAMPIVHLAPITAPAPTTALGPIFVPSPIRAPPTTIAVGSTRQPAPNAGGTSRRRSAVSSPLRIRPPIRRSAGRGAPFSTMDAVSISTGPSGAIQPPGACTSSPIVDPFGISSPPARVIAPV